MDTQNMIRACFLDLLKSYPLRQIKIGMICKELDIAKTTFYHYYADKYALMEDVAFHIFSPCLKLSNGIVEVVDTSQTLFDLFHKLKHIIWQNRTYLKALYSYGGQNSLYNSFFKCSESSIKSYIFDSALTNYYIELNRAFAFSCMGLTKTWLEENIDFSTEEYTRIIVDACPAPLRDLLSQKFSQ